MKKFLLPVLAVLFFWRTFAHQPRLVFQQPVGQVINVKNPEISQAFYGNLSWQEDIYTIIADTGFWLYINILVPDLPASRTDFAVDIIEGNDDVVYTRLDGKNHNRSGFFEPFGGDDYLKWPSRKKQVSAGIYTIRISNPDNQGKYALAVGEKENFPFKEMVNTYKVMPTLKTIFFEKPRYTTFWNYVWLMIVVTGGVMIIVIRWGVKLVKYIKRK